MKTVKKKKPQPIIYLAILKYEDPNSIEIVNIKGNGILNKDLDQILEELKYDLRYISYIQLDSLCIHLNYKTYNVNA